MNAYSKTGYKINIRKPSPLLYHSNRLVAKNTLLTIASQKNKILRNMTFKQRKRITKMVNTEN